MKNVQFNIRIEQKDLTLLNKIAEKRGEGPSDFARRAIRREFARLGFLNKQETRALEVCQN